MGEYMPGRASPADDSVHVIEQCFIRVIVPKSQPSSWLIFDIWVLPCQTQPRSRNFFCHCAFLKCCIPTRNANGISSHTITGTRGGQVYHQIAARIFNPCFLLYLLHKI